MNSPMDQLTKHGHDLQFGTNVLGHFYLTQLLLPTLIRTSELSGDGKARVVNTSSIVRATAIYPAMVSSLISLRPRAIRSPRQPRLADLLITRRYAMDQRETSWGRKGPTTSPNRYGTPGSSLSCTLSVPLNLVVLHRVTSSLASSSHVGTAIKVSYLRLCIQVRIFPSKSYVFPRMNKNDKLTSIRPSFRRYRNGLGKTCRRTVAHISYLSRRVL